MYRVIFCLFLPDYYNAIAFIHIFIRTPELQASSVQGRNGQSNEQKAVFHNQ
jgi:hypothetical protein